MDYFLTAVNDYALYPVTLELVGKWYRLKDDAERGELTRMVKAVRATDHMDASMRSDVVEAQRRIEEAVNRFVRQGEWAEAIGERVTRRFVAHGPYLWAEVPGLGTVIRSTVALERAHGADRRGIRHRRGQEATGEEMSRFGSLLAFWSNARCPWFVERILGEGNLWETFARQDAGEVRRRLLALPKEGRQPKVEVRRGKAGERLEALVKLLTSEGPIEPGLTAWAISVGALPEDATVQ